MNLFLTGTDTDVGKTYVAARLIRMLRRRGVDCIGMKPICCGTRADAEALHAAAGGVIPLNDVNPVWLRTPAAPLTAAMVENRSIDLDLIRSTFRRLRDTHRAMVVEGVGGWRVPITASYFISDLAAELALPVAVVVANRLGALNHTLLTIDSIRSSGQQIAGIILNDVSPGTAMAPPDIATATNRGVFEAISGLPVLFHVGWRQEVIGEEG